MLLANFNGKEHLRHRAVSLRQHGFLVVVNCGNEVWPLIVYWLLKSQKISARKRTSLACSRDFFSWDRSSR